ncbi:iron-sulfur cluster biosynthesis family protein [Paenibacillus hubeiensis]|uniref:iron-sulfur cluster biosynthesis family protein n=1 Tax=Paenibacillus hubeiensis TaxID=3077330 RepID=UPI0031BA2663
MRISITDLAAERLTAGLGEQPGYFKLFYDTENCGCNGVLVIDIVDQPGALDEPVETNLGTFYVDPKQQLNLEESMKLDTEPNYPSFRLSSDSGVLNGNLRVRDARASAVGTPAAMNACALPSSR